MKVRSGWEDLVVAGGVESMSRVPIGADGGAWAQDPKTNSATLFVSPAQAFRSTPKPCKLRQTICTKPHKSTRQSTPQSYCNCVDPWRTSTRAPSSITRRLPSLSMAFI
jgi:hypothetical protein